MTIAERLVAKRRGLGLSKKRAAKRWGVAEATLRKWERGEPIHLPSHQRFVARLLGP
jgi:DNA-binding transcriptional regulator YiaG